MELSHKLLFHDLAERFSFPTCKNKDQDSSPLRMQVGNLFRTRAFNFHARKAAPPRSLDTLTLRELYALKTETSNRALSAKMLADIYKRLESIHVQSTCRINTPLITQCLQSPIVSRNAQLAKHRSPSANMGGTTRSADKLGGTLGGSVGLKSGTKEKGSGTTPHLVSLLVPMFSVVGVSRVGVSAGQCQAQ